jgi:hypothetical protein
LERGSPFPDVKELTDALVTAVKALEDKYRKVCMEAGNANTRIYQILRDKGPLQSPGHFAGCWPQLPSQGRPNRGNPPLLLRLDAKILSLLRKEAQERGLTPQQVICAVIEGYLARGPVILRAPVS